MKKETENIIVNKINLVQIRREALDIQAWRNAHRSAENIYNPRRYFLYNIYADVILDTHLFGIIEKREAAIKNNSFILKNKEGKENKNLSLLLNSPNFTNFITDALDTKFWGHSLFEFTFDKNTFTYNLIPRTNVIPERGIIVAHQYDTEGFDYTDAAYQKSTLAVGKKTDLGLLLQASPFVIYKRKCIAEYAQYIEIFGQPIREGIYDGFDDSLRQRLVEDMQAIGSSQIFVHPEGTKINFIEAAEKANSAKIYTEMIDLCNAEMSKLILGNTLTTQQGNNGARSLGEVHESAENIIKDSDKRYIENILNYQLKPLLVANGFSITEDEFFHINESEEIDYKTRIDIDTKLNAIIPIDDDYFYTTYNIPKPKTTTTNKKDTENNNQQDNKQESALSSNINKALGFFGFSL